MSRLEVANFLLCLVLTVAGGLPVLVGVQPAYLGRVLVLAAALLGGAAITIKSVQTLLRGDFGVDVLASVAIWISVLLGEYIAAAIVVIMLNGGELAEDFGVYANTFLKSGALDVNVTRRSEETIFARIVAQVKETHMKTEVEDPPVSRSGGLSLELMVGCDLDEFRPYYEKAIRTAEYRRAVGENDGVVASQFEPSFCVCVTSMVRASEFEQSISQSTAHRVTLI